MDVSELARAAEERGFDSLFISEHTHIPTSRLTPPPTGEEVLGEEYKRMLDPFIALATAAAVTSRIRLGTGVALVAQHDPITFAKQIATLDRVSGGRLLLGIGYGWNKEEMADHGVSYSQRRAVVRERMLAMQALWSQDVAEYHGEHVSFEPSWAWPKPLQQPRPPVLLGGAAGPKLFAAIAEYGDGWLPIGGAGLASALDDLRAAYDRAGRDSSQLHVIPMGIVPSEEKIAYYRKSGVTEALLRLPSAARDEVMPILDDYARFLPR